MGTPSPHAARSLPASRSSFKLVLIAIGIVQAVGGALTALAADAPGAEVEASNNSPKARISVRNVWVPTFTVLADASASTDTDAWPIATYQFDFGDHTPLVVTSAPVSTLLHTYAAKGKYTVKLIVTDTGGKKSSSTSTSISVTVPPPEKAPVANLKVSKPSGSYLTAIADASGSTDDDVTPIATYRFDFGDGTPLVETTAPVVTATHVYAAAGKYTVKLNAIDAGRLVSKQVTSSVSIYAPPDDPPVARLRVTKPDNASLTLTADASASTDTDLTPIATYRFDFGDRTPVVVTDEFEAEHTYADPGSYSVVLVAIDRAGKTSKSVSVTIVAGVLPPAQVAVYAGYYDTHHPGRTKPKPSPWMGASSVVFVGRPDGSSGGWDSSALRIENLSSSPLTGVVVTVDIGSDHYSLWGTNSLPAGKSLVLAQTSMENFDGSDTNPAGCYGCSSSLCVSKVSHTIPVVHVTVNGKTTDYIDGTQVLNTNGVDAAGCPATGTRNDESHAWQQIYPRGAGTESVERETLTPEGESWLAPPFPNPARSEVGVRFRTAIRGYANLAIYDVAGRKIQSGIDGILEAGEYRVAIDLRGSAPGIYFCDLQTANGRLRKPFAVMN